jgi:homoserine O-acetyltransferase
MNSLKDIPEASKEGEIGKVSPQIFEYKEVFEMSHGELNSLQIKYETYGELNIDRSNAILICHALTGDHHVAGICAEDERKGWWDHAVGPGKAIDTNEYFVICSNVLGACQGSTGPTSINPSTQKPYGMNFPDLTIKDMVCAQKLLLDHLKVTSLYSVVGGSMGGMQALQWIVEFPSFVKSAMIIAATAQHSAQTIAFNEVGRTSIKRDPHWNNGEYTSDTRPEAGLAVARMMAHITYLSDKVMAEKFGRDLMIAGDEQNQKSENNQFTVESYLHYQGLKFVDRFDANTYLKLTKALDRFDLVGDVGLDTNLKDVTAKVMVVGFTSDWLYTPSQNKKIAESLQGLGKNASYLEIDHDHGHDSFLLNSHDFLRLIKLFLKGENFEKPVQQESQKLKQSNNRSNVKKEADLKVISDWVKKDEKVLDLGCGRGTLLEHLRETKNVKGLGVDYDSTKAAACISRGVNVYQGDIGNALAMLSGASFDWVVFSRMVEELPEPGQVILDALKIGKRVAVSFVNHGYWKNRLHFSKNGSRITNDVYRENWENSHPLNHFSVKEFESFCNPSDKKKKLFRVGRKVYHHGNWRTECRLIPNLMAGLAIYELVRI